MKNRDRKAESNGTAIPTLRPSSRNGASASAARTGPLGRLGSRIGYRTRTLGLAGLLALLALVLTLSYVRSYKAGVERGADTGTVMVAVRDIPAGTLGSAVVGRGMLEAKELPRRSIAPGAISAPKQIATLVATGEIFAGEQVTIRRFRPARTVGLRGELKGTRRAISVAGDRNQTLAGILERGDRVDVVAGIKRGAAGREELVTSVILRNLLVLRPAEGGDGGAATGGGSATIVLQLTDRQSQRLFYAMKNGQWALTLRPLSRAAESPAAVDDSASVLRIGEGG